MSNGLASKEEVEGTFVRACSVDEVSEGDPLPLEAEGFFIGVVRLADGDIVAFEDECTHAAVPLCEGEVDEEGVITCNAHGAQFDLHDGKVKSMPASQDLEVYETKVEDGDLYVKLPF